MFFQDEKHSKLQIKLDSPPLEYVWCRLSPTGSFRQRGCSNALGVPGPKMPLFSLDTPIIARRTATEFKTSMSLMRFSYLSGKRLQQYQKSVNQQLCHRIRGNAIKNRKRLYDITDQTPKIISICDIRFNKELWYNIKTAVKNYTNWYTICKFLKEQSKRKLDASDTKHPRTEEDRRGTVCRSKEDSYLMMKTNIYHKI